MKTFTCGLRVTCARGRCMWSACANPDHKEYRGEDPHEAMARHRVEAHQSEGRES